jgi:2-polyprenyl-3-methyl-5-hydroxy-6-metoxy-1,4-benzoquinol methylase
VTSTVPAQQADPDYDHPRTTCPLCDGGPVRRRIVDFLGHGIDVCSACGVEFMNPRPSDEALRRLYSDYISLHPAEPNGKFRSRTDVRRTGKRRAMTLLAECAPGKRILMVGCGDGLELREAKACGWQPEGFDIEPETTAAVAEREGVPVHCGDFHDLPSRCAPYDALFLDQVIEHPKDPGLYLQTCRALLRSGGVVYLGMPNLGSLSNRMKTLADRLGLRRRRARHYNTRHHLTFFTPSVLVRHLRERLGMQVLCLRGSPKPQRNPLTALAGRLSPLFDSSFFAIARRP